MIRRYAGFKKCAAPAPKHKKNGVPSGNRYILLCKIGDDLLKLLKKKLFGIRLIMVCPRGLSKNDVKKNNSAITLGSLPKTIYQSRFAPKNKEKNNVFLMQNFMIFTKVSAPGTFLGAAPKVQNGDPK